MALFRRLGLDRNPLRRRTDRIESAVQIVLLAVFLCSAPLLASGAGRMVLAQSRQHWHQVTAVVLGPAARSAGGGAAPRYWVPASWRDGSGVTMAGRVPVPAGTRPGSSVRLWADPAGQLSGTPPRGLPQVPGLVLAAWAATFASLALGLLMVAGLVRWVLDRRRMRAWAADWTAIGPRWTARR